MLSIWHYINLLILLLLQMSRPVKLLADKAAGPGIYGMVLKHCAASLAKLLTALFNISFVAGCIPDECKLA